MTSRCNLACDFCYGPRPTRDPAQVREAVAEIIAQSATPVVTLCGGEPLLVRQLPRHAQGLQQAGKRVVLNTNGELLRRRHAEMGRLPYDIIGISIDGPGAAAHRAMRGARADFHETLAAAQWVSNVHPDRLKVATVVSAVNVGTLVDLARLVGQLRPAVWRLCQYSPWGVVNHGGTRHALGPDEFAVAVARAAAICAPVRVAASSDQTTRGCLIVDPTGAVLLPHTSGYQLLGRSLDGPIDALWARAPGRDTIVANKRWLGELWR